jgi:hypothetical protein
MVTFMINFFAQMKENYLLLYMRVKNEQEKWEKKGIEVLLMLILFLFSSLTFSNLSLQREFKGDTFIDKGAN